MSFELSTFQWVILVVGAVGTTYYFTRCETMHYTKHRVLFWFNHDFDRWLGRRLDGCEKWNQNMTPRKWYLLGMSLLTIIYSPIIVWNLIIYNGLPDVISSQIPFYLLVIEYIALNLWFTYLHFHKKSSIRALQKQDSVK